MAVSVNARIKAVRKALGLSQRAFCKGIFLSQGFYAQIEGGIKKANERICELISTKYNVNREWLLTGKGEMFYTDTEREIEEIISLYRKLNPFFRKFITRQLLDLVEYKS